jgi:hypothetical protein
LAYETPRSYRHILGIGVSMRMQRIAGPKLRAQAIARTIAHLERQAAGKTDLGKALTRTTDGYTQAAYIEAERKRLDILRNLRDY